MRSVTLNSPQDKNIVRQAVSSSKIFYAAVARLYVASPDPSKWTYSRIWGAAVFCIDKTKNNSYFIRLVDIENNSGVIWEQEFYEDFNYIKESGFFHSFETDDCLTALEFVDEGEADVFYNKVQEHISKLSTSGAQKRNSFNSEKRKSKIDKNHIGLPADFRHLGHVGYTPGKGFSVQNNDPEWNSLFDQLKELGISADEISSNQEFIQEFLQQNQPTSNAPTPKKKVPPPPPPSRHHAPPPPPPPRRANASNGPPPPPPPSRNINSNHTRPVPAPPLPPSIPRVNPPMNKFPPTSAPPPPTSFAPPPPMTSAPPPPPPPMTGAPPPPPPPPTMGAPPPPPPPPPTMGAPPPPPPPPPTMGAPPPPPPTMGAPPPPPPPMGGIPPPPPPSNIPAPTGDRSNLMASIRAAGGFGTLKQTGKLKKAEGGSPNVATVATGVAAGAAGGTLASSLADVLKQRKQAMVSDDENDDDDEWD